MLTLLGILLILHGLAHAGAGMWATGSPWLVTLLWMTSTVGFMWAGFIALGTLRPAHRLVPVTLVATVASLTLLALLPHAVIVPGVLLDVGFVIAISSEPVLARLRARVPEASRHRPRLVLAGVVLGYTASVIVLRPWAMRMGTTPADRVVALTGDMLYPGARYVVNNAITVNAPVDSVWPWIAQIGQDRAGFYSYSRLENMVGARITNSDSLVPAWQQRHVGDLVRAVPHNYLGGMFGPDVGWHIVALEPGRGMVLENWGAFTARPIDATHTRVQIRQLNPGRPGWLGTVFAPAGLLVFEPAHFIMQRGMLRGIKSRAEGRI